MKAIVLLGPPGAGKGTVAEGLEKSGYCHISTGDMLRDAAQQGSEVGLLAQSYMDRGELAPDDVVIDIMKERLSEASAGEKFMFDGFPRTLVQAEKLTEMFTELDGELTDVVLLDCPDDVIVRRLTGRRVCRTCSSVYHIDYKPPAEISLCDLDKCELYQRVDDNEETVRNRLAIYAKQTEPLVAYYADKGLIYHVDATVSIQECLNAVLEKLG